MEDLKTPGLGAASHITVTVKSTEQWIYLCMIVFGLHSPFHSVEGQARETVPLIFTGGLPTSTQLKKIPPRHADRPT